MSCRSISRMNQIEKSSQRFSPVLPSSQSFSSANDLYFELIKATYYTCSRATKFISQVLILSLSTQIQHIDLKCFELSMCFSHGITVLKSDDLAWLYTLWLSISFTYLLGYVDLHFVCLSNFVCYDHSTIFHFYVGTVTACTTHDCESCVEVLPIRHPSSFYSPLFAWMRTACTY